MVQHSLKDMHDALNGKIDYSALGDLEQSLLNRLNAMIEGLSKQFADKADTKKALKALERQMKNLFDMIKSGAGGAA
jgi:phage tail tape-measure protein